MKVSQMFPSKYLKGAELKQPVTVTIASITTEEMYVPGEGKTTRFVMHCEKASKGVILNRTLANQIANMFGDDTDRWAGKRVTLYPESLRVAGVDRIAIRAKAAPQQTSIPETKEPSYTQSDLQESLSGGKPAAEKEPTNEYLQSLVDVGICNTVEAASELVGNYYPRRPITSEDHLVAWFTDFIASRNKGVGVELASLNATRATDHL